jgi:hypothetical protein
MAVTDASPVADAPSTILTRARRFIDDSVLGVLRESPLLIVALVCVAAILGLSFYLVISGFLLSAKPDDPVVWTLIGVIALLVIGAALSILRHCLTKR